MISEHLIKSIRAAAVYNPEVQVAPACILWPDKDRQREPGISTLMAEIPELFILGDYKPESRTGPGIWLRCVIAEKIEDIELTRGKPLRKIVPKKNPCACAGADDCLHRSPRQRPLL